MWDALFAEGPKVLFRVGLALLKRAQPALLAQTHAGGVLRAAREAAGGEHDRDGLLKARRDGAEAEGVRVQAEVLADGVRPRPHLPPS